MLNDWYFTGQHSLEHQQALRHAAAKARLLAQVPVCDLHTRLVEKLLAIAQWLAPASIAPRINEERCLPQATRPSFTTPREAHLRSKV